MGVSISVIIPVYNEARTIVGVVDAVFRWGKAYQIIVVDDGSTDHTLDAVRQFGRSIDIISYPHNQGKGYAVAKGIAASRGTMLLFLDGDMIGLTPRDIDALAAPMVDGCADMVLGLVRFWRWKAFGPSKNITGVRGVWRSSVYSHLEAMKRSGYGLEVCLNRIHKGKVIVSVPLPSVYIVDKMAKQPFLPAMASYLKELREVVLHYFNG